MVQGEYLHIEIGKEYKKKLEEIAEKNQRSMTGQIRYWIEQVNEQ